MVYCYHTLEDTGRYRKVAAARKLSEFADQLLDEAFGTDFVESRKQRHATNLARLQKMNELGYVQSMESYNDGRIVIRLRKPPTPLFRN